MKKKLFGSVAALIALSVIMTSCDFLGMGGFELTDQAKIDKGLKEQFTKHVDPESIVYHMYLYTEDAFSFKSTHGLIYYSEPGSDEVQALSIMFSPESTRESSNGLYSSRKPSTGIPLKDVDFSNIAANVNGAIDILSENDIRSAGLSLYRIYINSSDPADVYHEFSLNQRGKTTTVGNRRETEYYDYKFRALSDGEIHYKE